MKFKSPLFIQSVDARLQDIGFRFMRSRKERVVVVTPISSQK